MLAAAVVAVLVPGIGTASQANSFSRAQALRSAKEYLRTAPFSFKGLVHQLKFEGYSTADARYGASHAGANWFRQAVRAAKQYLRVSPFSFSGLVHQLEFEGYTHAQAVYGAHGAGL